MQLLIFCFPPNKMLNIHNIEEQNRSVISCHEIKLLITGSKKLGHQGLAWTLELINYKVFG